MELKRQKATHWPEPDLLLIVPYGIETLSSPPVQDQYFWLLIVPYGIETWKPVWLSGTRQGF